jgi:hypothetical protein
MTTTNSAPLAGGFRPDDELAALVSDCIDGRPDTAQLARLETRLAADPEARRYYLDAMLLDDALGDQFSAAGVGGMVDLLAAGGGGAAAVVDEPMGWRRFRPLTRAAAAILLAVVVGGIGGGLAAWQGVRAGVGVSSAATFAEISRTRLAVPPQNHAPSTLVKGRKLGRGRLAIESGAIEITVRNGVMIVLDGPA